MVERRGRATHARLNPSPLSCLASGTAAMLGDIRKHPEGGFTTSRWKALMIKTLRTIAFVTAALASPAFAQEKPAPHKPAHALQQKHKTKKQKQKPAIVV